MNQKISDTIFSGILEDKQFLRWVMHPTPELDNYWEKRMEEDPVLKNNIESFLKVLRKSKVVEPTPNQKDKLLIWNNIEKEIRDKEKPLGIFHNMWVKAASTAAIVALLAGSLWFIFPEVNEIDYSVLTIMDEEVMKSGTISLVLSESQIIDIKNDSSTIAYNSKGIIQIGEEETIETTETPRLNQLIVPYGKTTSIVLSDGTKVWVNSGSTLIYPPIFGKNKREIFLSGEAYLDVAKDNIPFIIKTNKIDVNVLGTQLNVTAYNDEPSQSVVLVSGSVEIKSQKQNESIKLVPEQLLTYESNTHKTDIQIVDVMNYTSWIDGYFLLKSESISSVLNRISRHYNVIFTYDKTELTNTYLSGKLDLEFEINKVLDNIALMVPISYETGDGSIKLELIK